MKNYGVAFTLCITTGWFGGHRYYLGLYPSGILYSFTCGLFIVGWILDIMRLRSLVDKANERIMRTSTYQLNSVMTTHLAAESQERMQRQMDRHETRSSAPRSNQQPLLSQYDELEKLAGLKEKGIISEEEFQRKKQNLLG
jgi:TM2 domain-containing membrane protein YozV